MVWPAQSPDLNPIESVWSLLTVRIGRQFLKTRAQVERAVIQEWDNLDVSDFEHYIRSMPERCQAFIDVNGGTSK